MTITLAEAEDAVRGTGGSDRRGDALIEDATHDSRQVRTGWLYCAIPGATVDGHDFARDAVDRGATALLVERPVELAVPQLRVPSVRVALGPVAAAVHGHPSAQLLVVGITGTNGKTTTAYLLEAAFGANGAGTGVIGTIETRIHGVPQEGVRTTPEATDLQRLLGRMHARGVDAVAMEVSSHGLDQHRVDAIEFDVAVFTNLTQDHLDYHGTLEAYYGAKARLFTEGLARTGVVCTDDRWGRRLHEETTVPTLTYGRTPGADVRVVDIRTTLDGTSCRLESPHAVADGVHLETRLLGAHNALNATAAYLACVQAGLDGDAVRRGLARCEGVPGRLEPVQAGQPFAVLVDYAHTPDALANAIDVCRELTAPDGRVHVVIGAGGDRDRSKRPEMGRIAAAADRAVLTSDNPRSEPPEAIVEEVAGGARDVADADVHVEVDRRAAIAAAIGGAGEGDVVLIAGKGHETGQEFADRTLPFDDRDVARGVLRERGWGDGRGHP